MTDKRALARDIVSARDLLAEVRIAGGVGIGTALSSLLTADLIGIGMGIVTQTCCFVKLQLPDATRPRAVGHQQITLFVIEHAGIDTVGPIRAPLICIVAGRQRSSTGSNGQVGVCPVVGLCKAVVVIASLKAGEDNRSLIDIRSLDVVGSKTDDGRCPIVTVDRHIHEPLARLAAANDIRSPLHALNIIAFALPAVGIEVAKGDGLAFTVLHLSDRLGIVGISISDLHAGRIGKERASVSLATTKVSPIEHIAGLRRGKMRAEEIVVATVGNYRGIMNRHFLVADPGLVVGVCSDSAEGEQADGCKELKMLHNYQKKVVKPFPIPPTEGMGSKPYRYLSLIVCEHVAWHRTYQPPNGSGQR